MKKDNHTEDISSRKEVAKISKPLAIFVSTIILLAIIFATKKSYINSIYKDMLSSNSEITELNLNVSDSLYMYSTLNKIVVYNKSAQDIYVNDEDGFYNSDDIILEDINNRNVYTINSSKPEGFYIMVGSFYEYQNALKLQDMNPTDFICYTFDTTSEGFNRVGLFISDNDLKKTEIVLKKIKMMNPDSWIIYNTN